MDKFSKKGFYISFSLHAFLFIVLIFGFEFSRFFAKPKQRHVFQLQQLPPKNNTMTAAKSVVSNLESISIPSKAPTPIAEKIVESAAATLGSVPPISLAPKTAKTNVIATKPIPPKTSKDTKISYNDFIKSQGKPTSKETKTAVAQTVTSPKIHAPDIKKNFEQKLSSIAIALTSTLKSNEEVAAGYQDYVRSLIDASWDQPNDFSGYNNGALIEFDIDKLGYIRNVKIVKSSGSRVFDESVRRAFEKVNSVGGSPDGKEIAGCRLTFTKKIKNSN